MPSSDALALVAKINKAAGEGSVMLASDMRVARRFTSGSLSLDVALGGGWPANHWVELIGKESNGKTALVLKTIAANQAIDPEFTVAWIAAEHYDTDQAEALGVDNSRVLVIPTQAMEFAFQTMVEFAASRSVDCIVLDSYPALVPDEEASKDMDESTMALGARNTGKFFRKVGPETRRGNEERPILGVIINQMRDKIGGFSPQGTPQTSPGGNAKNYAFYVRVEVRRAEWIVEKVPGKGEIKVGQVIKATTIKNKSAPPQQVAIVDFYFRDAPSGFKRGDFDLVKEMFLLALVYDVIRRGGAWYYFGEQKWHTKENTIAALYGDFTLQEEIRAAVLEAASKPRDTPLTEADIDAAGVTPIRAVGRREMAKAA